MNVVCVRFSLNFKSFKSSVYIFSISDSHGAILQVRGDSEVSGHVLSCIICLILICFCVVMQAEPLQIYAE